MADPKIVTLDEVPHGELDPHWISENLDAAEKSIEQIPAHYADAVATEPAVREWVTTLVRIAAESKRVVPSLTRGPSLRIIGPTGTGKTHQAYGAIRALAVSGLRMPWTFSTAADVYARMRPRHGVDSEAEFAKVSRAALLVIDDLGAAKPSEWNEEINYRLINHRYEHELPTIVTSNLPPKDLASVLGERVTSRLVEMSTPVVLKGDDRRRAA
jgi:DNA replication protein DnaC